MKAIILSLLAVAALSGVFTHAAAQTVTDLAPQVEQSLTANAKFYDLNGAVTASLDINGELWTPEFGTCTPAKSYHSDGHSFSDDLACTFGGQSVVVSLEGTVQVTGVGRNRRTRYFVSEGRKTVVP